MALFIIPTKCMTLADYSFCDLKDIFEWQESYFGIVSNVSDSYAVSIIHNTDIIEEDHDNILTNVEGNNIDFMDKGGVFRVEERVGY
ncbi:unnamed protein product [Rhizophagus irregularis]|uniref:Uncharacterized protein n=1 Tax=Rhizophagus irregularis TaxID=588596 RepID=A0A2I1H163_9GLOM|nr:hypothetical protein RhiirA4_470367 [Rhizophagus irregularis]CAB4420560.1 unnamed protein product [Rhizophagus irregularis]CAB4420643.1 unnamed protein product [Rhizophagus irregularis]